MRHWPVALFFITAGAMHFVLQDRYSSVMPPYLPAPNTLIYISGAAEIAGGLGMLFTATRRAAAWGLVWLLIAVFPANIYMAQKHLMLPDWMLWLRLPLQPLFIGWVSWAGLRR